MFEKTEIIVAIVSLISLSLGAIISGLFQIGRNKTASAKDNADLTSTLVSSATALLEPYKKEVEELRETINEKDRIIEEQKKQIAEMLEYLK